jgi:hypothetical protein
MFTSFSSTDAGCDQCADLTSAFNTPVQNVNNAVSQYAYGTQLSNNQQQNYYNNVMNSNSVGLNQSVNTTQLNNNLNNLQPPTNNQQSNAQVAMQQMVQKAVAKPDINNVNNPNNQSNGPMPQKKKQNTVVEPFEQKQPVQVNIPSRLILANLASVILVALALNEASKYYINRCLQMAEGTPHYYAFYAFITLIIASIVYYVSTRLIK